METSRGLKMASMNLCRSTTSSFLSPLLSAPRSTIRSFSTVPTLWAPRTSASKEKAMKEKAKRRRKKHSTFVQYDLRQMEQFSLCEAMRYIKAFEVQRNPEVPKYDVAIKMRTKKDGPIVRNQIRLPHAVKTDIRIAVICPPGSAAATQAKAAGAVLVGEEEIFQRVKEGKIDFDRCIAVPESMQKLNKEGMPRILGPRGLMPSVKLGTVADKPGPVVRNMMGGSLYRERQGVVRMAVGRLSFTAEQLRDNVRAYVAAVKKDAAGLSDQVMKEVAEVVLSSTNSPGFSLNGDYYKPEEGAPTPKDLSVA
ncbi:ribosomal protein L1 [Exophiala mesophila]|uniref:Ribosomal protein L1 n=1 Tax=Exophiala mesophila TaxID=212818 RepID=A0A0D1ZEE0_EXOME|nr:ribosomal protein L1 [Exophiala mesophila]KIV93052.1 ribosomal protein L1 [Exophiala mesophila]